MRDGPFDTGCSSMHRHCGPALPRSKATTARLEDIALWIPSTARHRKMVPVWKRSSGKVHSLEERVENGSAHETLRLALGRPAPAILHDM